MAGRWAKWRWVLATLLVFGLAVTVAALAATSLTATPSDLSFGDQRVDAGATAAQATTIKNTDATAVTIESIGTDNPDFAVDPQAGDCDANVTVLAQDEECTVHVTFNPSSAGDQSGTLAVTSSGDDASVSLSGRGTDPVLTADPTSIDFGDRDISDGGETQSSTVTNTGTGPVDLDGVNITGDTGDFTQLTGNGDDCTSTTVLQEGETCEVRIEFAPTVSGSRTATATVDSDAPDTTIDLQGNGTFRSLSANPTSIDFGGQDIDDGPTDPPETSVITNDGTGNVTISDVSSDSAEFSVLSDDANDCAVVGTLAPGGTCNVRVVFDPTDASHRTGTVTVTSDAPDVDIAVEGDGTQTTITAAPDPLAFGGQDIDDGPTTEDTATVTNSGPKTLTISGVGASGDSDQFIVTDDQASDCKNGKVLAPNATCDVRVKFDPSSVGSKSATYTISAPGADDTSFTATGDGEQTTLDPDRTSVDFGGRDIDDGPTGDELVTFTNSGPKSVSIDDVQIAGADFARVSGAGDCDAGTTVLAPNESCNVRVEFDPATTGSKSGSITVSSADAASAVVSLAGEGEQTTVTPSPTSIDFGGQDVDDGATSPAETVTFTNSGPKSVPVDTVVATDDFTVTGGTCSPGTTTLAPSGSCTVTVAFDPVTTGPHTGTLTLHSSEADDAVVDLSGEGEQTTVTPSPTSIDFGGRDIDDGATSPAETVTFTNSGPKSVPVDTVVATDDFTVTGGTCSPGTTTLAPNGSCTVTVAFDPTTVGTHTGTLTLHSSEADDAIVDLEGVGEQTTIDPDRASVDFGGQDIDDGPRDPDETVSFTNSGPKTVAITGVSVTGAGFSRVAGTGDCDAGTTSLAPGESCDVTVRFDPSAEGPATGSISVTSPDAAAATVDLQGNGDQTTLSASPASHDFGQQDIDAGPTPAHTFTVEVSGPKTVHFDSLALIGDQRAQFVRLTDNPGTDCTASTVLAPNETCEVRVRFNPSYAGPKTATVRITSPDVATFDLTVTGEGTQSTFPRSDAPFPDGYLIDGPVNAVAFDSAGRTYIGGAFSSIGQRTGRGVKLTKTDDQPAAGFPDVDGPINAVVADGSGGWFIGGSFNNIGGTARPNLAHILSTGALDTSWSSGANNTVNALALSGSNLFVGGDFTQVGGQPSIRLAKLSASSGALDTNWTPDPNSTVNALTAAGGSLYVGGTFSTIGGAARARIARVDAGLGDAESWNPGADGTVRAIAVDGTDVYAGGSFTSIGGQNRNRIAKLSSGADTADATWNPNANGDVLALAVSGGQVYAGGAFTTIGAQSRNRIARLSSTGTGAADTWNPNANGSVNGLRLDGTDVYAVGAFTTIGGQNRNRIARLSTSTGAADSWNPNANGAANAIAIDGNDIYVGGAFTSVGGQIGRSRLARLLPDGTIDPDWAPVANNTVNALIVSGTDVYVGGAFTDIGGQTRNRIAKLTTATGAPFVAGWNPNAGSTVFSLALSGGDLFVGGQFTTMSTQPRNRIAKLDAASGTLDPNWNPGGVGATASVLALAVSGSDLIVGGNFVGTTSFAGQQRFFLAKVATGGNGDLDPTWAPDPDSAVRALAVSGSNVFVGGDFLAIAGQQRAHLAKLSTAGSGAADMAWDPSANDRVRALTIAGTDLYAGGDFTQVGGVAHGRIVRLPVGDGGAQDSGWDPAANGSVNALASTATRLAAGGAFTTAFGQSRQGIAIFDLPRLTRDPSSQQFGSQSVSGGPTGVQVTQVGNSGTTTLAFSSLTLGGANADQFELLTGQAGDCTASTTLGAGGTCNVRVRFDPTSTGIKAAWVSISASNTPDATIGLAGRGSATGLTPSTSTLSFDDQDKDDGPAAERSSTLTNSGSETVTLTGIDLAGHTADFTRLSDEPTDCFVGRELLAGQSCAIRAEFDPTTTGSRSATITVSSDAASDLVLSLVGEGIDTKIEVDDSDLAFGKQDIDDGAAGPLTSVVSNTGTEDVNLAAVNVAGAGFALATPAASGDCDADTVLAAGETCDVRVVFDPATTGQVTGSVTIDSDELPDLTIALSGEGTQTSASATPATIDLGDQDIDDGAKGPSTSVVKNTGTEDLHFSALSKSGADFAFATSGGTDDCTATTVLAAGEDCEVRVTFDPTTVGSKTGSVTVDTTELPDLSIPLLGEGIQTSIAAAPTSLAFGKQDIDDGATAPSTSVITNTGTEEVNLAGVSVSGDGFALATTGGTDDCDSSTVLAAGDTCDVRVTFDPATVGSKTGSVTVDSNELPDLTISLTGEGTQTSLSTTPASLAFGGRDIDQGASNPQTSVVKNTGTETVTVDAVSIAGTDAGDFLLAAPAAGTDCAAGTELEAGETCDVRVRFDPGSVGAKTANVAVDTDVLPDLSIGLTGSGTQVELSRDPATLAFGKEDIDNTGTAPMTSVIENTGTEPVDFESVEITGTGFSLATPAAAGDCDADTVLAANETCDVRVVFDPDTTGAKSGTVTVTAEGVSVTVSLTGEGTQTSVSATPTSIDLGDQDIDDGATAPGTSVVKNTGTEDLHFSGISKTGADFALATSGGTDDCTASTVLAAGEDCEVRVTFDPSTVGSKTGSATVDTTELPDLSIPLAGEGIDTELSVDQSTLAFGKQDIDDGATAEMTSVVSNTGTESVSLTSVGVSGTAFAQVTGGTDDCGADTVLAAGEDCDVRVTFDPATIGSKTGSVTVDSDELPDLTISLTGEGTQTSVSATPTSIDLGKQDIDDGAKGPSTSVVKNTGTEDVHFSALSKSGADFAFATSGGTDDCTATTVLAAGEDCDVRVTFDPSATGARTGSVTVDTTELPDLSIPLAGEGTQTSITATPTSLAFGKQDIDDGASSAQATVISNTGTESVSLTSVGVSGTAFAQSTGAADDCDADTVLAAGEDCNVRVTFDPAAIGPKTGSVTVDSDQLPDLTISLSGEGTQTSVSATPTSIDLGDQDVDDGATAPGTSVVKNTGTEDLHFSGISKTGADFALATGGANDCTASTVLTTGAECNVRATFDPSATGARSGSVTVDTTELPDLSIPLAGQGTQTSITATPSSIAFGKQDVDDGATSAQTTVIENTGTESVSLAGVTVSGAGFAHVTGGADDCDADTVLAAGEECDVRATFDPATTGPKTGSATVDSDELPDLTISLTGEGTQTSAMVTPTSIDLGDQDIDDGATDPETSVVRNTGSEPLHFSAPTKSGADFALATGHAGDCTASTVLTSGAECDVRVTFDPSSVGSKTGSATVHTAELPDISIPLSGEGTQTSIAATPASIAFDDQDIDEGAKGPRTTVIENTGTEPVSFSALTKTGADFALATGGGNDCDDDTVLGSGEDCDVRVTFDPSSMGAKSGSVTVDTEEIPDLSVLLSGNGAQTELSRSPASLAFGSRDIDEGPTAVQESTVTNSGNQPVTLSGVAVTGSGAPHFERLTGQPTDCASGTNLAGGATCKLRLRFDPSTVGSKTGTATATGSGATSVSVSLTGTGTQTGLTATPASLAFGSQDVDDGPTAARESTITNTGTEPVTVTGVSLGGADAGQFELLSGEATDCSAGVLAAGEACKLRARFDPASIGAKSASATLATAGGDVIVGLGGTGTQTALAVAPTSLAFGNQDVDDGATGAQEATVTNTGSEPVDISRLSFDGSDPGQFERVTGEGSDCSARTLSGGESCKLRVRFDPSSVGGKSATAMVASSAGDVSVALGGAGIQTQLERSPADLDFGSIDIDGGPTAAQESTVTNTGTEAITLSGVALSGAGAAQFEHLNGDPADCAAGAVLPGGGSCKVRLRFDPSAAGPAAATATVGSSAGDVTVGLSGSGIQVPGPTLRIAKIKKSALSGSKKRLKVTVTARGGTVRGVLVRVTTRGGKVLGTARAGNLSGKKTVTVKMRRKLGRGRFVATARGKDTKGNVVAAKRKFKR